MPDLPDHQRRIAVTGLVASGAIAGLGVGTFRSQGSDMSTTVPASGLADTLLASAPHPSLGEHADTFGRLIGSWAGTYRDRDPGGPEETGNMEVHFGWVLQGRAVQDTWIAPPRTQRDGSMLKRQTYGTTVRVFDPKTQAWQSVWLNPVSGARNDLIGRRVGNDVVQFCVSAQRPEKWVFSKITASSFDWHAYLLADDGLTWKLDTEFHLRRTA